MENTICRPPFASLVILTEYDDKAGRLGLVAANQMTTANKPITTASRIDRLGFMRAEWPQIWPGSQFLANELPSRLRELVRKTSVIDGRIRLRVEHPPRGRGPGFDDVQTVNRRGHLGLVATLLFMG